LVTRFDQRAQSAQLIQGVDLFLQRGLSVSVSAFLSARCRAQIRSLRTEFIYLLIQRDRRRLRLVQFILFFASTSARS